MGSVRTPFPEATPQCMGVAAGPTTALLCRERARSGYSAPGFSSACACPVYGPQNQMPGPVNNGTGRCEGFSAALFVLRASLPLTCEEVFFRNDGLIIRAHASPADARSGARSRPARLPPRDVRKKTSLRRSSSSAYGKTAFTRPQCRRKLVSFHTKNARHQLF